MDSLAYTGRIYFFIEILHEQPIEKLPKAFFVLNREASRDQTVNLRICLHHQTQIHQLIVRRKTKFNVEYLDFSKQTLNKPLNSEK